MFKEIQLSDRSVRPFTVSKNWDIDLYTNASIILTEDEDPIHVIYQTPISGSELTS